MKLLKLINVLLLIVFISSCTKDSFYNQINETKPVEHHELYVSNGMLVFDSQANFDATLKKVQEMDDS
ncbi:MAG: hypothetical protein P1P88_13400, partial [Bacteroidales bacterium]|nr:hypothetical protein [Bacteroidales bacterium]